MISKHAVDVLGLSSWPHCVEWLYNSGRLKVTHKARVKFSIGSYHEMVVCDVVPMDICRLLLGRPWQYDAQAIHDGRSNTYTFWDYGKKRTLKQMDSKVIKIDEVFAPRPEPVKTTPKPRMASIQEGGDDVDIPKSIASSLAALPSASNQKGRGTSAGSLRYVIPARRRAGRLPGAVRPPFRAVRPASLGGAVQPVQHGC